MGVIYVIFSIVGINNRLTVRNGFQFTLMIVELWDNRDSSFTALEHNLLHAKKLNVCFVIIKNSTPAPPGLIKNPK